MTSSPASVPSHMIPVYSLTVQYFNIHLTWATTNMSRDIFFWGFPATILYAFSVSSLRATCPAHHMGHIWSAYYNLANGTYYVAPKYEISYSRSASLLSYVTYFPQRSVFKRLKSVLFP
jgi:hypothetical protein